MLAYLLKWHLLQKKPVLNICQNESYYYSSQFVHFQMLPIEGSPSKGSDVWESCYCDTTPVLSSNSVPSQHLSSRSTDVDELAGLSLTGTWLTRNNATLRTLAVDHVTINVIGYCKNVRRKFLLMALVNSWNLVAHLTLLSSFTHQHTKLPQIEARVFPSSWDPGL